jgi:hypothetical protein
MALQQTDLFPVGRGAATYKVTLKELQEAMPGGSIDGGFANSNYGSAPPAIDGGAAS